MTNKIVIPTNDQTGLNAHLAAHFGRAQWYTVIDIDEGKIGNVKVFPNMGEHAGGVGFSHDNILKLKPTVIIVYGMGPRGLTTFHNAGVAVMKANADTVNEVINAFIEKKLDELTEGCQHAHHC